MPSGTRPAIRPGPMPSLPHKLRDADGRHQQRGAVNFLPPSFPERERRGRKPPGGPGKEGKKWERSWERSLPIKRGKNRQKDPSFPSFPGGRARTGFLARFPPGPARHHPPCGLQKRWRFGTRARPQTAADFVPKLALSFSLVADTPRVACYFADGTRSVPDTLKMRLNAYSAEELPASGGDSPARMIAVTRSIALERSSRRRRVRRSFDRILRTTAQSSVRSLAARLETHRTRSRLVHSQAKSPVVSTSKKSKRGWSVARPRGARYNAAGRMRGAADGSGAQITARRIGRWGEFGR